MLYDTSISSFSTVSAGEEDHFTQSSAPTSPNSSNMSPDLLQTDFYNSDNLKDHAKKFRLSIVHSDSMDSVIVAEKRTNMAMTNSPSFSALASVLEEKALKTKTPLQQQHNVSTDTIIQKEPTLVNLSKSPNLIQLDDEDFEHEIYNGNSVEYLEEDIFKTPEIKQSDFNSAKYHSMLGELDEPQEDIVGIVPEIIDTPKLLNQIDETHASTPKLLYTPKERAKISSFATTTYSKRSASLPNLVQEKPKKDKKKGLFSFLKPNKRTVSASLVESSNVPPPISKKSPKLPQSRSFSLETTAPKVTKRSTSSSSLFTAFKRKSKIILEDEVEREVDTEAPPQPRYQPVEESTPEIKSQQQLLTKSQPQSQPQPQPQPQQELHNQLEDQRRPIVSSIHIHDSQKEQSKSHSLLNSYSSIEEQIQLKPQSALQYALESPTQDTYSFSTESPNYVIHDTTLSEDEDFNEDFNSLSIKKRPTSQISQNGEVVFPKSLNPQEVESIVSIERSRSMISSKRHSLAQQNTIDGNFSITDSISVNAREEGMSVEYGVEMNSPDVTKSPVQSALKKYSSSTLQNYLGDDLKDDEEDQELFKVDEYFSRFNFENTLEEELKADKATNQQEDEEQDDISNLLEFADFIDFGGDLELNFDIETDDTASRFLSSPPTLPLQTQKFNLPSPQVASSASPSLSSIQNSPLSSPFLQQSAFIPNPTASLTRPISMSFRGLKAPVFVQPNNNFNGMDNTSVSSSQSSTNISKATFNKRVIFSSRITLYDVYNAEEYDRCPDIATCNQLTPALAQQIRVELNELKSEMEVHQDSRCYTHFF